LRCGEPIDIIAPALYNVEPINNRLLKMDFSEEIDSSSLKAQWFSIIDTNDATKENIEFTALYRNPQNTKSIYGVLKNSLDTSKIWKIICSQEIKDKSGK
jgi:hypothetical protein